MNLTRTLRFSLRRLLAAMLLLGVVHSAGMYASPAWKNMVAIVTSLLLLNSLLGAWYRSGRGRAFWSGFAIFGWGLFGLRFAADEHVLAPRGWIMDVHDRIKRETLQERPNDILDTFFEGSLEKAVATLLRGSDANLSGEELERLAQLIKQARKEGR